MAEASVPAIEINNHGLDFFIANPSITLAPITIATITRATIGSIGPTAPCCELKEPEKVGLVSVKMLRAEELDDTEEIEVEWNAAEVRRDDEEEDSVIAVVTDGELIAETVEDVAEEGEPEVEVVDVEQFPVEHEIVVKFLIDWCSSSPL